MGQTLSITVERYQQRRHPGRRPVLDQPAQRRGVQVLGDQVAQDVQARLPERGEVGTRSGPEVPVPARPRRDLGQERAAELVVLQHAVPAGPATGTGPRPGHSCPRRTRSRPPAARLALGHGTFPDVLSPPGGYLYGVKAYEGGPKCCSCSCSCWLSWCCSARGSRCTCCGGWPSRRWSCG